MKVKKMLELMVDECLSEIGKMNLEELQLVLALGSGDHKEFRRKVVTNVRKTLNRHRGKEGIE